MFTVHKAIRRQLLCIASSRLRPSYDSLQTTGKLLNSIGNSRRCVTSFNTEAIISECLALRKSLQPLNDSIKGPLEKHSEKSTVLPFVFLLGNHSSGKSSFVNYVFQRKVQTAGVAPTDDSFTIILPGIEDADRDGPATVGDPDMGFDGLKSFGPNLIHHTQLKIRTDTVVRDFAVVDSPGMIDSPIVRTNSTGAFSAATDRGYDFEGVCRWYAERADVILLFFDPDKPGTTGETLSILTNALSGMDHKLHIILNKADQFSKIHDFARAYGSLCWNLSKVIQRKDLPRIYTMCLPASFRQSRGGVNNINKINDNNKNSSSDSTHSSLPSSPPSSSSKGTGASGSGSLSIAQGLSDLESTREDVLQEVFNSPKRRLDNEISRVADASALLQLHFQVVNEVLDAHQSSESRGKIKIAAAGLTLVAISQLSLGCFLLGPHGTAVWTGFEIAVTMPDVLGIFTAGSALVAAVRYFTQKELSAKTERLLTEDLLGGGVFQRMYARRIAEKDETLLANWRRVREHIKLTGSFAGENPGDFLKALANSTTVSKRKKDLAELDVIIEQRIPELRRKAAPSFHKML